MHPLPRPVFSHVREEVMGEWSAKLASLVAGEVGHTVTVGRGSVKVSGTLTVSYLHNLLGCKQVAIYTVQAHKVSFMVEQVESVTMYPTRTEIVLK